MLMLAIGGVAGAMLIGFSWLAMRRRRLVMADPLLWPRALSRAQLTLYGNAYLRAAGWEILAPWELNIYVVDDSLFSLSTAMRDVAEKSRRKRAVVGVLTQQVFHAETRREAELGGTFVVGPADLPDVETAIRRAGARHAQWRQAATAA